MNLLNLIEDANTGYDNLRALMQAVQNSQDAVLNVGSEPITLTYPEARFMFGKYKAYNKAGRQEEFIADLGDPVKFDLHMKQLRQLLDKQKNFRGSVPGERGVTGDVPQGQLSEIGNTPAGQAALKAVGQRADDTMSAWSANPKSGYSSTPTAVAKASNASVAASNRQYGFGIDQSKTNTVMARDALRKQQAQQGVPAGPGDPQITPGMKTQYGTVVKVNGNTVTVKASNGELTTVNIQDIDQAMAEGSSENKYSNLSNQGVNRGINRAGDDFNRMMDLDQAESPHYKTQHQQDTKQRLKTKPMTGPKGVLPEQAVAEGDGNPDIQPGMKVSQGTVVKVDGNTVTVKTSNGDMMTMNIHDIDQAVAEGFDDMIKDVNRKAKEKGIRFGKPFKLNETQVKELRQKRNNGIKIKILGNV